MGSPRSFVCKTCRKDYYLGYGSSVSWMTERYIHTPESLKGSLETVAQFDVWPDKSEKFLAKNQNFRSCLAKHELHDWFVYNDENTDIINSDPTKLMACYATGIEDFYETLVEVDWDKYEHINMAEIEQELEKELEVA
jgi:hypothetical protein